MNYPEIKVGIICPCDNEYQSCKEVLKLREETEISGRLVSSRKENEIEVHATKAGVGKINCSSATQLIIDKFHPDFIIDVGASGSLSNQLKLNDIVCGEYAYEYYVCTGKILKKTNTDDSIAWTVIKEVRYQKVIKEFSGLIKTRENVNIEIGNIASGERDVNTQELKQKLYENFSALTCNWETSAVLKTAQLNRVASFSFRVITDLSNENMNKDYTKNCNQTLNTLFLVLNEFIFRGWMNRFIE